MPSSSLAALLTSYKRKIRTSKTAIYGFSQDLHDRTGDGLNIWHWPVDYAGSRFSPSELVAHRATHDFLGPCCLCPLNDPRLPKFVESAIHLSTTDATAGEYIASCARGLCGYVVLLERFFDKIGVPLKRYPARAPFEIPPLPIDLLVEDQPAQGTARLPLKRSYAMLDITGAVEDLPAYSPPSRYKPQDWELWNRLDTWSRPGLTEKEYRRLLRGIVKCKCGLIVTGRRFEKHTCLVFKDLTSSDSDSGSSTEVD